MRIRSTEESIQTVSVDGVTACRPVWKITAAATPVTATARASPETICQKRRYGLRKKSAMPVGMRATTLKTPMKRSESPKAYMPLEASSTAAGVRAVRMATAAVATRMAATYPAAIKPILAGGLHVRRMNREVAVWQANPGILKPSGPTP